MRRFEALLRKDMSRKDFLKFLGMSALTFIGVANILSYSLGENGKTPKSNHQGAVASGFGSRKFGE